MTDPPDLLGDALRNGAFHRLVLSRPRNTTGDDPPRYALRPVIIRGELRVQWTARYPTRESHENLTPEETVARFAAWFPARYRDAHLDTTAAEYDFRATRRGELRVHSRPVARSPQPDPARHDRRKQYLIPEGRPCPFLEAIGVMTPAGNVRARARHKFRQINRFLEFIEDVYSALPAEGTLRVIDFGCGKSYLTFATHHLLHVIHGREVDILGLDRNAEVIATCRSIGEQLELEGLHFQEGAIDETLPPASGGTPAGPPVHLAVSLHACDTATDDALARAVEWQTAVILAAPCCQHELAATIHSEPFRLLTAHGILRERLGALATDALRAAALEAAGYRTQVIEFIDTEHTPKNILIRAVRSDIPAHVRSRCRKDYAALKALLGAPRLRTDRLLDLNPDT